MPLLRVRLGRGIEDGMAIWMMRGMRWWECMEVISRRGSWRFDVTVQRNS